MKPCKYCNGTRAQGIGQDYCTCIECDGTGMQNNDMRLIGIVAVAVVFSIVVTVLVEVFR